jgi:hypothetical protein
MAWKRRRRLLVLTLGVLGVLLLGCAFGGYRYLDTRNRQPARIDIAALQARAAREQPIGGGEAETVAFLRSLGFPDQHIRIQHFAAPDPRAGRLARIEGWIPQQEVFYNLTQIRAYCKFDESSRLLECPITRGGPLRPNTSPNIDETTPVAAP